MYDRTGNLLIIAIIIGMILGVVAVALFGEAVGAVKFLGDIFLNALKMIVIPLLFASMVVGITNLGDIRKLGRTGLKTVLYFLATSSIAVIIGLTLVNIFQPGSGVTLSNQAAPVIGEYSFLEWLTSQIPSNIIQAAADTQILPIIIFALIFGGVLTTIGSKGKPVIAFFDGVNEVIMKIVHIIMWFAPIGIFGLVAGQLAEHGGLAGLGSIVSGLWKYFVVVVLGLAIHAVVVLPLIAQFVAGKNPIHYFIGMAQAVATAFATASSAATLPVTMDCVENKNDVDKRASSFVLPLGATINMDGTALYEAVAAMFIAQAYGIELSLFAQITIFATAILASIGAAGIPQAGLVTMVLVLQAVGLPLEGIGLILAIDWFLDRCRTAVNVWGDSIGAAVIATSEEIGLVDRRHKKQRQSPERGESSRFSRRGDTRGRKFRDKDRKEKTKSDWKKDSPRPQQREVPSRDSGGGRDPRSKKRFSRGTDPGGGFKMTEQKEVYAPDSLHADTSRSKGAPDAERKAENIGKPKPDQERSGSDRSDRSDRGTRGRGTFGRKPYRSRPDQHGRPENESATGRGERKTHERRPTSESTESSENSGEFSIPKFPEKILDELASAPVEQEEFVPEADRKSDPLTDEIESEPTLYQTPVEYSGREDDTEEAAPKKSSEQPVSEDAGIRPEDAFSTLDKMVLGGDMSSPAIDDQQTRPTAQGELPPPVDHSADREDDTEAPSSVEQTDDTAVDESPKAVDKPRKQFRETSDQVDESTETSQDVAERSPETEPEEEGVSPEWRATASDSTASYRDESDAEDESDDNDDDSDDTKIRYGRTKKKKISR